MNGHHTAGVADVERMTNRLWSRQTAKNAVDHVIDVAPRADLTPVVVNRYVFAAKRLQNEAMNRAFANLARPVNVEGADGHGRQPELSMIVVSHVLSRKLTHRVRPSRLADSAETRQVSLAHLVCVASEDLTRRKVNEAVVLVVAFSGILEDVVGADDIHLHRRHWHLQHRIDT